MAESEQVYGGRHYPPQRDDLFVPCRQVSGNMAYLCRGIEAAIGGVVIYTVGVSATDWEIRVFRYMPGYGDSGVSTYMPKDRIASITPAAAHRLGILRGQIINGIFVDGGAL